MAEENNDQGIEETKSDRERSFSRRALIQAGWVVPIVMAVQPVRKATGGGLHFDASFSDGSASPFGDDPFEDASHSDNGSAHVDLPFFDFEVGG